MPPNAVVGAENVTLTVSVEANRVKVGDTINGTLTAINDSTETVDITHPGGCAVSAGLYFDGASRTEAQICSAQVVRDELAAGETKTWEFAVRARGDLTRYDDAGEHEFQPVPPGRYDLFAGISIIGGTWYAPSVTIEVTA
jgi:hypothetical protein